MDYLQSLPNANLALYVSNLRGDQIPAPLIINLLHGWLFERHRQVIDSFRARLVDDSPEGQSKPPPNEEVLREGLRHLKEQFDHRILAIKCIIDFSTPTTRDYLTHLETAVPSEGLDLFGLFQKLSSEPQASVDNGTNLPPSATLSNLDDLLERTIFAAESEQSNAPSPEVMEEMVEDFIRLNTSRSQSYYHRGVLHGTFTRPFQFQFPGADEERRLWYLCGLLHALHRKADWAGCLSLLEEQKELTDALDAQTHLRCGALVLTVIFEAFARGGKADNAANWLKRHADRLSEKKLMKLITNAHGIALEHLRGGRLDEASSLFAAVSDACGLMMLSSEAEDLRLLNDLRRAEVNQKQNEFEKAELHLNRVIQCKNPRWASRALSQLGLVTARFPSLVDILPEKNEDASRHKSLTLENQAESFKKAVELYGRMATEAHFCLGVMKFLKLPRTGAQVAVLGKEASEHLKQAVSGFSNDKADYGIDLLALTRLMLAITLLETNDEATTREAAQHLDEVLKSKITIPPWVYKRALAAAAILDDPSLAENIANALLESKARKAYEILWETEIAKNSRAVRGKYLDWLIPEKLSVGKKCQQFQELLKAALLDGAVEQAEDVLDALEGLAVQDPECRKQFQTLLIDTKGYSPAWENAEAELSRAGMYELSGEFAAAAGLLKLQI